MGIREKNGEEVDVKKIEETENTSIKKPEHIAIIMDGNRRWAKENKLPSKFGHKKGAEVLEKISRYCNKIGIKYLTVYAFSTENWKRAKDEVMSIMILLNAYLDRFIKNADVDNMKIKIIGDLDSETVPKKLRDKMHEMEEITKNNTGMIFNIAFNYGGRSEIVRATKKIAEKVKNGEISINNIDEKLFASELYTCNQPDPDLVIRTSNELRTSNFLPWQITYSEFLFLKKYWPDFNENDIDEAIVEYSRRHRRKGK